MQGILLAQDNIQLMQYNLLFYGNTSSYCTSINNNTQDKNERFKTVFQYVKPDILTVNEMAENPIFHDSLLKEALNVDGITKYKRATLSSAAQGDLLVNMLYYNSEKLTLYKHDAISTTYRATDVYTLFYNVFDLAETNDTLFITSIVTHLKAGNTSTDANTRASQTAQIMSYIQSHNIGPNYVFSGDFNIYTSNEVSYQNLIKDYSGTSYLYDPIDAPGDWNNNVAYKAVHTQSSHSSSNGCASNGGLDDRFDFILASEALINGSNQMQLLKDSYTALGNDALHYNTSILAPPVNATVPLDVINGLYYGSDHLPVLAQIEVAQSYLGIEEATYFAQVKFQNPVKQIVVLDILFKNASSFETSIYDLMGRQLVHISSGEKSIEHHLSIDVNNLKSGIYFLSLKTENGQRSVHKFFKN